MEPLFAHVRRPPQWLPDTFIALVLCALAQAEVWVPFNTSLGAGSSATAAALGVAMTLPLAFRRVAPVAVAVLVCLPAPVVAAFVPVRLLFFGGFLPLILITYTVAARTRTPRATAAVALPFAAVLAVELEIAAFRKPGEVVFDWLWFSVAAIVGFVVRSRSVRAERSETRVSTLEAEREVVVREERARIARELHDVIAHSVSVILVQAGAAEPLVAENPEQACEALRSIRAAASDSLGEMRRLLGILRATGDELALTPQPTVAELDPLLAQTRATGLDVGFLIEGDARPLAPGVALAAYRIVQEALTNTRKHGRASRADVKLRYSSSAIEIEVGDDGTGTDPLEEGGHGLVGMRERAELYNGTLDVGTRDGGGFIVRAVLPA
jgi:signal transduction histidine kinase